MKDENGRLPSAVGVICASDPNDPEAHAFFKSTGTDGDKQHNTAIHYQYTEYQITNITQVINIINNVTTNGTGTTPQLTIQEVMIQEDQ